MGRDALTDKQLIKETYAASLQPERLAAFEDFWEAYIDERFNSKTSQPIEDHFLRSHFSMALGIVERIRHDKDEEDYFHRLLMSHPGMAFIMEAGGKIIASNPDAIDLLEGGIFISALPINAKDQQNLLKWTNSHSMREKAGQSAYAFKEVNWGNGETVTLMLAPVEPPKLSSDFHSKTTALFLVSRIDLEVSEAALQTIQENYILTLAEATIAMHLANGKSVKNIVKLRGTSEQTVRSQVKQILAKTGSRDIADLVRLMLSLGGKFNSVTSQTHRFEKAQSNNNLMRIYNLILPDGRYLEYIEQGHPNGHPVLHIHCITKGIRLTSEGAKKAVLKNWRVITPIRAGFSNSDPNLQKSPDQTLNAATKDYKFLLDHLGIKKCILMSGWGGPFAQRFALVHPDMVMGILQIGCAPVWTKEQLNYFKTRHRVIVKTSFYAPAAAPYLLRVAKAMIDSGRSQNFVSETDMEKEQDISSLKRDPELLTVTAEGYERFFQQGVHSFLKEIKVIHTEWLEDSEKITVPVTLLHGSEIKNQPEIAFDKYFSAVSHAKLKVIEGAGIYIRYNHFDRVLEELQLLYGQA